MGRTAHYNEGEPAMTTKELIEFLSFYPPDAQVILAGWTDPSKQKTWRRDTQALLLLVSEGDPVLEDSLAAVAFEPGGTQAYIFDPRSIFNAE
jgi:hypothetical protein